MAHRVFRAFPSPKELADRIDEFLVRLSHGEYTRALTLCPIEDLAHADHADDELVAAVRGRLANAEADSDVTRSIAALGQVARGVDLTVVRGSADVLVCATFAQRTDIVAHFILTESNDHRWTLWFDRFERKGT